MVKKISGEEIEELKGLAATHFWPHGPEAGDMSEETGLKLVASAEGVWVQDVDGKRWFDSLSAMWLKNIGHGRKEIADAVYAQMVDISYSPGGTVSPATVKLAAKVARLSPDPQSRVYFTSGGSESVETALKMAKNYQKNVGQAGRYKMISRRGSYHGSTHACMSLGGGYGMQVNYGPLVPGNIHVAQTNQYRCVFCRDNGRCNLECARDVERAIQHENPTTVAAFIGEPISASAGIHVPHPQYWPTIREICDKYGVLMIFDEVITAFGRTGVMFASEHWGIQPDIFTVAKALTSGYLPLGAAVASKKISDALIGDNDSIFRQALTFGGNPASCAAGLANLEIIERENLVENSAKIGDYLFERLQSLYDHRIVGDVRGGKGLLCAVELVKDRDSREPFPKEINMSKKLQPFMVKHGLLGRAGNIIFLAPPLTVTKGDIDYLVERLDRVIGEVEETL